MDILPASDAHSVVRAMAELDAGHLVIVPGDLRYFLVGDALDDDAVERLFLATHRGADRPLTVLLSGYADVHHVGYGDAHTREASERLWPGPTVISMKPRPWVPDAILGGEERLRAMVPRQEATQALARQFGPLAAVSARIQGEPDSLDARSAMRLHGHASLCLDAGTLPGGQEDQAAPEG